VPSGDQALYDHVLDTALMLGAVPPRFAHLEPGPEREFAMARGTRGAAPLELTKWFDTNDHYLVPEIGRRTRFVLDPRDSSPTSRRRSPWASAPGPWCSARTPSFDSPSRRIRARIFSATSTP